MRENDATGGGDFMEIDDNFVEWLNVFLVTIEADPFQLYTDYTVFYDYLMTIAANILPEGDSFSTFQSMLLSIY